MLVRMTNVFMSNTVKYFPARSTGASVWPMAFSVVRCAGWRYQADQRAVAADPCEERRRTLRPAETPTRTTDADAGDRIRVWVLREAKGRAGAWSQFGAVFPIFTRVFGHTQNGRWHNLFYWNGVFQDAFGSFTRYANPVVWHYLFL